MSSELERVRAITPPPAPPSEAARATAMAQLRGAIADEPVGLHDRPERDERDERRDRDRHDESWRRRVLLAAAVVIPVLVVAFGALALRSHRGGSRGAAAPGHTRGRILAGDGQVLVGTRAGYDVQVTPAALPRSASARAGELDRLAGILGVHRSRCPDSSSGSGSTEDSITCAVQTASPRSTTPVTVATGVSAAVRQAIGRGAGQLPGVGVTHTQVATYPRGALAASVLGTVAPTTGSSAAVGRSGLEASYNAQLAAGENVRTTLDLALERAADRSLAHSITVNHAAGGAVVAIDPRTGAIDAIDSAPAVDPAQPGADQPGIDLAVQSAGPVGVAFGPITALAALESGHWRPGESYDDTGAFCIGTGAQRQCRDNSGHAAYGVVNLASALRVGDDGLLYDLGALTNRDPRTHPQGGPLQQWARALGIGRKTGIDLPGETVGTLPTPAWRAEQNRLESECDRGTGPFAGKRTHPPGGCGIADGTNRPWSTGDNLVLAVGQGDVQITPVQLAGAYAALANGGTVVRPHLAATLTGPDGTTVRTNDPAPTARLHLSKQALQVVQAGMHQAASAAGGTSTDVFGGLPGAVAGEVGTTQSIVHGRIEDDAWYAGYVTATRSHGPLVVVVWVQAGGFGDGAAAPVARQLFSQWLTGHPGPYTPGHSTAS